MAEKHLYFGNPKSKKQQPQMRQHGFIDWHAARKFVSFLCGSYRASACGATFRLRPLVVGCLIVLLPCACGIVAVSLARLNISLGIVLAACVMPLNLLSFCLLDMVGLSLIKRVTLMLCKLNCFVCKRSFGPFSILDLCLLVCWSWGTSGSLVCPLAFPLGLPCLRGLPL